MNLFEEHLKLKKLETELENDLTELQTQFLSKKKEGESETLTTVIAENRKKIFELQNKIKANEKDIEKELENGKLPSEIKVNEQTYTLNIRTNFYGERFFEYKEVE